MICTGSFLPTLFFGALLSSSPSPSVAAPCTSRLRPSVIILPISHAREQVHHCPIGRHCSCRCSSPDLLLSSPPSALLSLHLQLLVSGSSSPAPTRLIIDCFVVTLLHLVKANGRSRVIGMLPSWRVSADEIDNLCHRPGGELVDVGLRHLPVAFGHG